jgi:hypothetical protein
MTTANSCLFFDQKKSGSRSWRSFLPINIQEELLEFSAFQLEDHVVGNPDLVTIYYAGMLATAYACAPHVTYDEDESSVAYPDGSERDDLEQIHEILTQIGIDKQQRKTITDASWTRAQKILSENWPAVDALATVLLKRESLSGRAAHRLIWQTVGYSETDWRFQVLHIKHRSA